MDDVNAANAVLFPKLDVAAGLSALRQFTVRRLEMIVNEEPLIALVVILVSVERC